MSLLVLDPALIGLSLVYIVSLNGMLQYAVRLSAEVENLVCIAITIAKWLVTGEISCFVALDGVSGKNNGLWEAKKWKGIENYSKGESSSCWMAWKRSDWTS